MKILAIDTSARHLSLAIGDHDKILTTMDLSYKKDLSRKIGDHIALEVKKARLKFKDLDAVVVGLGPGSFTGLRVGLAAAKALCFSLDIPLVGISSLDALAYGVRKKKQDICVIGDARRKLFYACFYGHENGTLIRKTDYLLAPLDEILKRISGDVIFVGDGIMLAKDDIKERGFQASFAPPAAWKAQAKYLLVLGAKRLKNKESDHAATLTPIYLYPEDCQVQQKRVSS